MSSLHSTTSPQQSKASLVSYISITYKEKTSVGTFPIRLFRSGNWIDGERSNRKQHWYSMLLHNDKITSKEIILKIK